MVWYLHIFTKAPELNALASSAKRARAWWCVKGLFLKTIWDPTASERRLGSHWMSHIKHFLVGQFFMCYKSPSTSFVWENAALFFCCEAPKTFCGIQNFPTVWGWDDRGRISIFWWTAPLTYLYSCYRLPPYTTSHTTARNAAYKFNFSCVRWRKPS